METEKARQELNSLFGQQLIFNRSFDKRFGLLKQSMQDELIKWCRDCKEGGAEGSVPNNPKFKDKWVFFRKIGNGIRCMLIKLKNSDFIELHLFDHKEYDDKRLEYGYKKSSYYGS
jgi:hypothetical protein